MPSPHRVRDDLAFERSAVVITATKIRVDDRSFPHDGGREAEVPEAPRRMLAGLAAAIAAALLGALWLGPSVVGACALAAAVYLARMKRHGLILTWESGSRLAIFCTSAAEAMRIRDALEIAPGLVAAARSTRERRGLAAPHTLGQVTGVPGYEVEAIQGEFAWIDVRVEHAGIEAKLDANRERVDLANAIRQAEENGRHGR
ncbi:DUF6232 family protein [Sorangium sp. So ce204]|uniref:DUF6232 family protein n=1 Tax=Sorangium sp. So ce204 TaxID=3133288 RepID=UPI003F633ECD